MHCCNCNKVVFVHHFIIMQKKENRRLTLLMLPWLLLCNLYVISYEGFLKKKFMHNSVRRFCHFEKNYM